MRKEEAKKIAENYVDFYLREWSNLPYQANLDADGQKQLLEKRDQVERDARLPLRRVGEVLRQPAATEQWNDQVAELVMKRSTPLGRLADDVNTGMTEVKRKLLKIKF